MRLLLVGSEFAVDRAGGYRPGGLQQLSRCNARALAALPDQDELEIWGLLDGDAELSEGLERLLEEHRSDAVRIAVRGFGGSKARMAAAFARHHRRFDRSLFMHLGVGQLANLGPGRPHGLWIVGIEARRPLPFAERRAAARACPLLSISDFSSQEMLRHNPGLPRPQTVHLCVEPDARWRSGAAAPEPGYVARERAPVVLIAARMARSEAYKGHDALIAGWPSVRERVPDAELWVVGAGDDVERLRALAAALPGGAGASVRFLGQVDHEQLLRCYAQCRVFAMPSTGEGFGLVFVEAMRWGVPCVCSHDSAAEIVQDGVTGLVVDQQPGAVADACARLLADDVLADRFGAAGRCRYLEAFRFDAFQRRLHAALAPTARAPGTGSIEAPPGS